MPSGTFSAVPVIGFGTAGLYEKTEAMVSVALEEGYR